MSQSRKYCVVPAKSTTKSPVHSRGTIQVELRYYFCDLVASYVLHLAGALC